MLPSGDFCYPSLNHCGSEPDTTPLFMADRVMSQSLPMRLQSVIYLLVNKRRFILRLPTNTTNETPLSQSFITFFLMPYVLGEVQTAHSFSSSMGANRIAAIARSRVPSVFACIQRKRVRQAAILQIALPIRILIFMSGELGLFAILNRGSLRIQLVPPMATEWVNAKLL